ncbi:sensor histidine kinase [Spirosoma validum]|uniref:histidine kinase n=1 Tax=Spirosoma validum TaxID=2771355 RepID=A0A927B4D6_9BACT|nr:HAMP domain-containing sensor histidine kinase [Spirosoma validum]MBD2754992.1 HAMP domain-containing histidine kinase [Spirosoma validum]
MSLRSRIVLAVTAVFASISLLAGWLMLSRAEVSLQNAFDRTIQTRADWLLSLVSVDPVILPLPTDTERMRVTYRAYGHNRELFRSPGFPDKDGGIREKNTLEQSYRSVTTHTTSDQLPTGDVSLTLAVPDASLRQDIQRLRWVFGLGWLLSVVLAFGGGYVVAGWLLKPIQQIVSRANEINDTSFIDPIPLPESRDELYQLTDTLNRMLGRIRESVELQRNFFGAAAHELRTPLAVMKTGLEVTIGSDQVDERTTPFLTGQLDEVSRLTRLLEEFLTLSRPDEGLLLVKPTPTDLSSLIKKCAGFLTAVAADYDVKIRTDGGGECVLPLLVDAAKLEHILLNLLENAIKYAVSGSDVIVTYQQAETCVIIVQNQTLRETGPTLNLMQPYFQADPFREGHGLGLWISHRLTTILGGTLRLDWQDYTFTSTLNLPISPNF